MRKALDADDLPRTLDAARQLAKHQAASEMALGTALRITALLGAEGHPWFERAAERWLKRAEEEGGQWRLIVIAEVALRGTREPAITAACRAVIDSLSRGWEWRPYP